MEILWEEQTEKGWNNHLRISSGALEALQEAAESAIAAEFQGRVSTPDLAEPQIWPAKTKSLHAKPLLAAHALLASDKILPLNSQIPHLPPHPKFQ